MGKCKSRAFCAICKLGGKVRFGTFPRSVKSWCEQKKIQRTRGRPYKKDDNVHVEQKNWTHVVGHQGSANRPPIKGEEEGTETAYLRSDQAGLLVEASHRGEDR